MKFASCCFAIFLVCLVSFHQSSAFKLQAVKPNQNEINAPVNGQYYIQNVATGLVIGAVNGEGHTGAYDLFSSTVEPLEEGDKSMILWQLERRGTYTGFRSEGPYAQNDMQKYQVCLVIGCAVLDRDWTLISRGEDTWELRHKYYLSNQLPETCLTGHGLGQSVNIYDFDCDNNNLNQTWRFIRNDDGK